MPAIIAQFQTRCHRAIIELSALFQAISFYDSHQPCRHSQFLKLYFYASAITSRRYFSRNMHQLPRY